MHVTNVIVGKLKSKITGEWNDDDLLDLLIVFEPESIIRIFAQDEDMKFKETDLVINIQKGSAPFVLDLNGDFKYSK